SSRQGSHHHAQILTIEIPESVASPSLNSPPKQGNSTPATGPAGQSGRVATSLVDASSPASSSPANSVGLSAWVDSSDSVPTSALRMDIAAAITPMVSTTAITMEKTTLFFTSYLFFSTACRQSSLSLTILARRQEMDRHRAAGTAHRQGVVPCSSAGRGKSPDAKTSSILLPVPQRTIAFRS